MPFPLFFLSFFHFLSYEKRAFADLPYDPQTLFSVFNYIIQFFKSQAMYFYSF